MNRFHLILRTLRYYHRPYLAILAGVAISTAVITGALILGDSVKHSLHQVTERRLGNVRFAIPPGQALFRQQLAGDLEKVSGAGCAPVLITTGIVSNPAKDLRINSVNITGIDDRFGKMWNGAVTIPGADEAVVGRNVAERLGIGPGDEMVLRIFRRGKVSVNAPFVAERQPTVAFRVTVKSVADEEIMGRFSLKANQVAPFNVFVSLGQLTSKFGIEDLANCMLISEKPGGKLNEESLDSMISRVWRPEDAGIDIKQTGDGRYEMTTGRIFFNDRIAEAISGSISDSGEILTYLVNNFSFSQRSAPYSFATAAGPGLLRQKIEPGEIIINTWLAEDLGAKTGDRISLRYFKMGRSSLLNEEESAFVVKGVIPMDDPAEDRTLMPQFPGIAEAGSCREWETGAPVDLKRVREKDENYWKVYRGTPKAFISMSDGKRIWNNPFGKVTAFRFTAAAGNIPALSDIIMRRLKLTDAGIVVRPVYSDGLAAAGHSTDLGSLFLSLSFFLIAAALLLTALLFSLHARSRMAETGILAATGFRKRQIMTLLGLEALFVTIPGALLGIAGGIAYTRILLLGLNTLWQDVVGTRVLQIELSGTTLVAGFLAGVILSLAVLMLVLFINLGKPLSHLVGNEIIPAAKKRRRGRIISLTLGISLFIIASAMFAWQLSLPGPPDAEGFLTAGGIMMCSLISIFYFLLSGERKSGDDSLKGLNSLALLNAGARRGRSMAIVALMALGTFSIIVTGANRKSFSGSERDRRSGTGGFLFWAESSFPVTENLNSREGEEHYALHDEPGLSGVKFIQMHQLDGEDASCLNLNQVARPVILSVDPRVFDRAGSFSFAGLDPSVNRERPWSALNEVPAPGVINAFADQTVITYGLGKNTGDTLFYLDESGASLKIVLKGGLDNSVFQGNLLVSDSLFRIHFPSASRSKFFLVDGPYENREMIASTLEKVFRDHGLMAIPASERLAAFNSVENTYLSIFMLLGALGILLGTVGLAVVLLRNLWDRRREIALYLATGFTRSMVKRIIMAEYLSLLLAGMAAGVIPAVAGTLPSMLSSSFTSAGMTLLIILLLILLNGIFWIWLFTAKAMRREVQPVLMDD